MSNYLPHGIATVLQEYFLIQIHRKRTKNDARVKCGVQNEPEPGTPAILQSQQVIPGIGGT